MATDVKPHDFLRQLITVAGIHDDTTDVIDDVTRDVTQNERDDSAQALMKLAETPRTKETNSRYRCVYCYAEFGIPLELHKHMNKYHCVRKRHQCSDCGKRYASIEELNKHSKSHQKDRKPFQCTSCSVKFSTRLAQQRHSLIHTGETPHECGYCAKKFRSKVMLHDHVAAFHTGEQPRPCDMCEESFQTIAELRLHALTHGNLKNFKCTLCETHFGNPTELAKHVSQHQEAEFATKFPCSFCDEIFADLSEMEDHINTIHPPNVKSQRNPLSVSHVTNFICGECQIYFASYDDLSAHLQTLHNLYQCKHCYTQYTSRRALRSHFRQSHSSFFQLACHLCDRSFGDLGSLNRHVASHDVFTCPHCDASFKHEKKFLRHKKQQHNPETMETCTICAQKFASVSRLQRHLQCHLPPALHKCKICNAGFNDKKVVERHLEIAHHVTKPRPQTPPSQTYQVVQDGETINVVLVEGASIEDLKAMIFQEMDQVSVCHICNTEFMDQETLEAHLGDHGIPELLLAIVEQEKARATISGAPIPKEILVTKSGGNRDEDDEVDSEDELNDEDRDAYMPNRPKPAPAAILKRYTSTRCRFCDKLLASEHDLQVHEKMHLSNFDFRCTACNEEFVDGEDLIKHRRMHKKRLRRSFQCAHCGIIMNDANLMKQHIDTHTGFALEDEQQMIKVVPKRRNREQNRFACQVCRLWFHNSAAFRKHMSHHRDGKAYHCLTCGRGFNKMATLKFHEKSHKAVAAHGCGICSQSFDRSYRLTKHMMFAHNMGRYVCGKCDLRFHAEAERNKHEKKHKPKDHYSCAICDDKFVTVHGLKVHVKTHKTTEVPEKTKKAKEMKYIISSQEDTQNFWCMICQAVFDREEDLTVHGSNKHFKCDLCATEFADALELECHGVDHAALSKNVCLNCGESFENHDSLWQHTLTYHSDSQACRCEKCHTVLLSHRHSQIHMLTHPLEEEADFHCDYFCSMCQMIFTTESFLNIHNERHKPCQICNELSDDLTLHLLQNHSLPQVEKCYHCDKVLTDPVMRAEHLNTHAVSPEVLERCAECETGFGDMATLDDHIKTGHNLEAMKCFVCGMLCLGKDDLSQHLRTEHTVYSVHRCKKCPKIFLNTTMDDMLEHAKSHKPDANSTCCACGAKFSEPTLLKAHLQTHETIDNLFKCIVCGAKFSTGKTIRDHMRVDHGILQIDESRWKCGICDKTRKLGKLEQHAQKHLNIKQKYSCHVCPLGFTSKASIERHILIHTAEKPGVCITCGKGFRNLSQLKVHQDTHIDTNKKCTFTKLCRATFKSLSAYRDHLVKNHGCHAPFECLICHEKFVFRNQLREHMSKHGGGRQYKCNLCQFHLPSESSLMAHLKKNHGEHVSEFEEHVCQYCLTPLATPEIQANHVCPTVGDEDVVAMGSGSVAMDTEPVAMGSDPVAIAMSQISTSQDRDGFVYISMDETMESTCPICMIQFATQEEASAHMMLHQEVISN